MPTIQHAQRFSYSLSPARSLSSSLRLNAINDFLHLPIVDDVAWHLYHIVRLLFCVVGAVALLLSFLVKLCTGAFITHFEAPEGRAILITGCDSGFGHDLALELVEKGWRVYAGCLTRQGMTALQTKAADSDGAMVAVLMDVTKRAGIDRLVKKIADECPKTLFAVVNNAGVDAGGLVDWTSEEIYRKVMDVNFFAMIAVCKACLPLLKESKGRIVNVTSIAGVFIGRPFTSAYAASKHGT
jgi:3-hydroxybutyrate dehydrogenase